FLNTGPAVSKTLRAQVQRVPEIRRTGDLLVTDLAVRDGICVGAHAVHTATGEAVSLAAKATIVATGGLTRLYARNSASINMGGDGYALALRAGVPHLFAAGEAVGGANGANRLSGNAISEALVFGLTAGLRAAALVASVPMPKLAPAARASAERPAMNPAAEIVRLQKLMNDHVGPVRTRAGLERALCEIKALRALELPSPGSGMDRVWLDLHDLRNMALVAEAVAHAALLRE